MNICFLEDTLLHGGTQIWVSEAIRYYLSEGEKVSLLAPENSWIVEQCRETKAKIITFDWQEVTSRSADQQLIWTAALEDCDVTVCTVHPPRDNFHCALFAAKCIQDASLETHLVQKTGTIVPEYKREFYLPNETVASSIITISKYTYEYLVNNYQIPKEKITLIYQGTDTQRFQSLPERYTEAHIRYQLPAGATPILGCIGSFENRKGQAVLLEVVSRLAAGSLPDIHLMLVGDGPDKNMLRAIVREKNLEKQVSFFPFTSEPEYAYERMDITILPSIYQEGLPNVILESMAMGVPVIASKVGGISEVLIEGQTGFLVPPNESVSLEKVIVNLWQDQTRYKEIITNAINSIKDNFNKKLQFKLFLKHFYSMRSNP